jgi:hypothetical protein
MHNSISNACFAIFKRLEGCIVVRGKIFFITIIGFRLLSYAKVFIEAAYFHAIYNNYSISLHIAFSSLRGL